MLHTANVLPVVDMDYLKSGWVQDSLPSAEGALLWLGTPRSANSPCDTCSVQLSAAGEVSGDASVGM